MNNHLMLLDLHRNSLAIQEVNVSKRQSVGTIFSDTLNITDRLLDSSQVGGCGNCETTNCEFTILHPA